MILRSRHRAGFTLVELLVAMAVITVLASIAVPMYRGVVIRADATAIIVEADMIAEAAFKNEAEGGRFPRPAGWGVVPPELKSRLPGGFEFRYGTQAEYQWHASQLVALTPDARPFDMVMVGVRTDNEELRAALRDLYRGETIGAGNVIYLVLRWA